MMIQVHTKDTYSHDADPSFKHEFELGPLDSVFINNQFVAVVQRLRPSFELTVTFSQSIENVKRIELQ